MNETTINSGTKKWLVVTTGEGLGWVDETREGDEDAQSLNHNIVPEMKVQHGEYSQ